MMEVMCACGVCSGDDANGPRILSFPKTAVCGGGNGGDVCGVLVCVVVIVFLPQH